jgi:hypothetical protein
MAPVVPYQGPRVDTRGLPEGYDPHKFYEYRYQKAIEMATDTERFLYQLMPLSLVKSLAFALDPTYRFKVSLGSITEENRVRKRFRDSVNYIRPIYAHRTVDYYQPLVNYNNVGGCRSPFVVYYHAEDPPYHSFLPRQVALPDVLSDTTSRTRLVGSKQGTFTMFKGYLVSPARSVLRSDQRWTNNVPSTPPASNDACIVAGGTYDYRAWQRDQTYAEFTGQAASLSLDTHSQLRQNEKDYNLNLMQAQAIGLLKGWSPFKRDYNLFRNLVELRDIPKSIRSLRETMRDARNLYASLSRSPGLRTILFDLKRGVKDIPNEYLSFHFGWKQTYSDLVDLLNLPEKMGKKINFLIQRSGKPTTFRSKRSFVSGVGGVPGFDYPTFLEEYFDSSKGDGITSRIERESEVRLVINATFDFPPAEAVAFRSQSFYERVGIIPRPTDIYNLVPWTWLIDWFSGLGNYVELIDEVNRDPSLINWGMLTCTTHGRLTTDLQSSTQMREQQVVNDIMVSDLTYRKVNRHSSYYEFTSQTRRDLATFLDVSRTSEPTSLSAYQKSILGALLAQRYDFSRSWAKPKS